MTTMTMRSRLNADEMYRAVERRDEGLVGAFFVGVKTTGVFCRPGCPARAPLRENCEFFGTAPEALQAGYRPCLRCRPLSALEESERWADRIVEEMERAPAEVLTAGRLRALGVEPARASRYFKRRFGTTVQGLSRARRVGLALKWIREGREVGRAGVGAGFDSESGFRKAVRELFGASPTEAAGAGAEVIAARWLATPIGPMIAGATGRGVCLLEFVERRGLAAQLAALRARLGRPIVPGEHRHLSSIERELGAYFAGRSLRFETPLEAPGSEFQARVWEALRGIEPGRTESYGAVAARVGRPSAVRAVARAIGENRLAIVIPCHRVIGADGSLTGYGGGLWRKEWLLEHEAEKR